MSRSFIASSSCDRRRTLCGVGHDPFLGGLGGRDLARDPALAHHEDPVAHPQDLGQLRRDHHDRLALGGQIVEQSVDLGLRPDIDAARRLVEDQDVGVAREPLRDDDLLLVAARQVAGLLTHRGRLDRKVLDLALRGRPRLPAVDDTERADVSPHRGQDDVRLDIEAHRKSVTLAVLGQVGDAVPDGVGRARDRHGLAVDKDLAAVGPVGAEDQPGHLGPTGTDQPGKAKDLAAAKLEADVADHPAAVEAADLQHDLIVALLADLWRRLEDRPADHHRDDLVDRRLGGRHRVDEPPVAHHGHSIGDLLELAEPMGDVDDADAAAPAGRG